MDCSPPGSSVHEIFQARILEWGAISFSRGSSQPRDRTRVSCTAGRLFTDWGTRETHDLLHLISLIDWSVLFNVLWGSSPLPEALNYFWVQTAYRRTASFSLTIAPFTSLCQSALNSVARINNPSYHKETAVSGGLKWDLSSLPGKWTWEAWVKTRNPSHQSTRG